METYDINKQWQKSKLGWIFVSNISYIFAVFWCPPPDLSVAVQKFSQSLQEFQFECIGDAETDDEVNIGKIVSLFACLNILRLPGVAKDSPVQSSTPVKYSAESTLLEIMERSCLWKPANQPWLAPLARTHISSCSINNTLISTTSSALIICVGPNCVLRLNRRVSSRATPFLTGRNSYAVLHAVKTQRCCDARAQRDLKLYPPVLHYLEQACLAVQSLHMWCCTS